MEEELRGANTRLEERFAIFQINFRRRLPRLYRFLTSSPNQCRCLKGFFGLFFGILLGYAFYGVVVVKIGMPEKPSKLVGIIFGLGLALGNACSVQIRCISWLLLPTLFSKRGRSYVSTFAVALLLLGKQQVYSMFYVIL